jgi:hypothetical protein
MFVLRLLPRVLLAAVAAFSVTAQATAADLPPIVVQLATPGKILDDIRGMAKAVGDNVAVEEFNKSLKEKLGEKGLSGVDLTRPAVFGIYLKPGLPEDDEAYILAMAPITDEKDFLELINRGKEKFEAVDGKAGLYKAAGGEKGKYGLLRMQNGFAYLALGTQGQDLDIAAFPAYEKLLVPGETAFVSARVYFDRLPTDVQKKLGETLEKGIQGASSLPLPPDAEEGVKKAVAKFGAAAKNYLTQAKDAQEAVLRIVFDPNTSEASLEVGLVGKPGSSLAADIAARKPTTNRFGAMLGNETAAGLALGLPLTNDDIREGLALAIETGAKQGLASAPPPAKATLDELMKGLARTIRSGEFDFAAAVNGPNKDGKFMVTAGLSFDDPAALEKELRELYKTSPKEVKAFLKLDAAKIGEQNVHVARLGPLLPPEVQNVIGDEAELAFAFAPKGVYLTFGVDPVPALKTALEAAPKPSRLLDLGTNPKRLERLATASNPQAGGMLGMLLGAEDKPMSAFFISVEGGTELKIRIGLNLRILPRAGFMTATLRSGGAPPPP